MPLRAVWKGAISFGMVVIPVKLYPATEHRDIRFVNLHKDTHTRIRMKRWSPHHDTEVGMEDLVKGYEYGKDQYVILEESDFDDLPVPSKHSLDIIKFVDIKTIDPIFFERTYVLEPEELGRKPYALLRRVMESTGRIAVGKLSLRQKEHLVTLRPYQNGLAVATMFYADEIRPTAEIFDEDGAEVSDAEIQMASMLVDQLTGEFDPESHQDEYRAALMQVIENRLGQGGPVAAAPEAPKTTVLDLMEALKASLAGAESEPAPAPAAKRPAKARKAV